MQCTESETDKVYTSVLLIYQGLSNILIDFGSHKKLFLD